MITRTLRIRSDLFDYLYTNYLDTKTGIVKAIQRARDAGMDLDWRDVDADPLPKRFARDETVARTVRIDPELSDWLAQWGSVNRGANACISAARAADQGRLITDARIRSAAGGW